MKIKQETILHPLTALKGLSQFHTDVSLLLTMAQTMLDPALSGINEICRQALEEHINQVRRHYQATDQD